MNTNKNTNTWNAKEYAKFSKGQKVWAEELINKLDIRPDDSILDIGCGDGKITALLAAYTHDGNVTGIDKDPGMIALASERYPEVDFQIMDAEKITFKDTHSIVFSNAALHWAHDHQAILSGIHQAMKANGKMLLQFGGHGNAHDVIAIMDTMIQEEPYRNHFHQFTNPWFFPDKEQYKRLLTESDFADTKVQMIPKDMVHETIADFQGWLRTTSFPYIQRLPKAMQNRFVDEVTETYIEAFPADSENKIHIGMMRIEVSARK